ncbi:MULTISPECIES: transposase [unclassified Mesorhizobium]|uniref:transposase n=1 Tax=unclassified Mesorhizobium TaxID=325217 RepID=UPI001FE0859C|nr:MULTISPECIES: transposase [unclassified Mesorhizobium]
MRRLTTIPGVGAITAASVKALIPDPDGFITNGKRSRFLAALTYREPLLEDSMKMSALLATCFDLQYFVLCGYPGIIRRSSWPCGP